MSLRLTEEMIIRKAKGNFSIAYIKNLKFFNSFLNDISIVSQCKSIESATFSRNNISSLRCFKNLQNLRELSLAENNISDINELIYLGTCPNLTKLWLKNNPISKSNDYRFQVIKKIPSLKYLDDEEITNEERNMVNTGSFFAYSGYQDEINNNYDNNYNNYPQKKRMQRPPSHDPMITREYRYKNNNDILYNKRDIESEEINYNFPMFVNRYDRFQGKKAETPSKIFDRYGNSKRGISPFNNNNNFYQENNYNEFGRNIPGSAQSHNRRQMSSNKYDNNPMEVSNNNFQQKRVVNFIFDEVKGLNNDELLYLIDYIDKKIDKMKY